MAADDLKTVPLKNPRKGVFEWNSLSRIRNISIKFVL